jgi:Fe-S cluster assembly protein SufD
MEEKVNNTEAYISLFRDFEKGLNGQSETGFHSLRKNAFTKFEELGFPTLKNEEWKYTNVAPILKHNFVNSGEVTVSKNEGEK